MFNRAINKYRDKLKWEIIEDNITSLEKACEREIFWISSYESTDKDKGYNLMSGGGQAGTHSESTKEKIRQSVLEHYENSHQKEVLKKKGLEQFNTKEAKREQAKLNGSKEFLVYNKNGTLVGKWVNKSQCARELSLNRFHISECLNYPEKRKSHGGYIFKYSLQ